MPRFKTKTDVYKYFTDSTLDCHWHLDFEFGVLLEGAVDLYVNNTCLKLRKGDGYFVSQNVLHACKQDAAEQDAVMFVLNFPALFLSADINGIIYEKYITPFLNTRIESIKFSAETEVGQKIITLLKSVQESDEDMFGYELECQRDILQIWLETVRGAEEHSEIVYGTNNSQAERMKNILSYIHENYSEKFTADDIAKHLNVSRGECFRCFKHFMNKRLVEYINEYRLQHAAAFLRETDISVTDISTKCGFENPGYFGKLFKEIYRVTPLQYRMAQIWTSNTIKKFNGYDYEYWKDRGNGRMIVTSNANNGSFLCEWSNIHNIIFRSGKKFYNRDKTHRQIGDISLKYDASFTSSGMTYISVYGWTIYPLVEWYIIEAYSAPIMLNRPLDATHAVDGDIYEIYNIQRKSVHTAIGAGLADFKQYWSIRKHGRSRGTVDVTKHFAAWESLGFKLGNLTEISLCIESVNSSGNALVKTNILSIAR